jgi:flagellar biosynthesis protein FlhG
MRPSDDAGHDLAAIDAQIDVLALDEPIDAAPHPGSDQAASLRRLFTPHVGAPPPQLPAPQVSPASRPRFFPPSPDRLATLRSARRARVVAVASGKGGVGKTSIAVNTAIMLARRGLRVTLLDADLGTANADVLCGLMPAARIDHVLAPGGLTHQDGARRTLADIAVDAPGGFRLVPGSAGIGRMADLTDSERHWLVGSLVELAASADVLLIDAAAGVGLGVTSLLHAADLAIVVTTPEPTAVADAYALIKCLVMEAEHAPGSDGQFHTPSSALADEPDRIALVVNQTREPLEAFATHARIARCCDRFLGLHLPMLGFIAQDMRVSDAVRAQKPLAIAHPDAPATRAILDLSDAIVNMLGVNPESESPAQKNVTTSRTNHGVGAVVRRLLGFSPRSDHAAEKC